MKFSISLENFEILLDISNLDLQNSPQKKGLHRKRALVGGSLEVYNLA